MGKLVKAAILAALVVCAQPVAAQSPAVEVVGLDGKSVKISIDGMTRHVVTATQGGARVEFEGVMMRDVLGKADTPLGEKLHGPEALTTYVLATARDGYKAVFAIAELDASFTDGVVMIADRRDGKRLDEKTGPLQIVTPDEKRAGRWVRQLMKLEVRQAK
ncbi:MAG: molybdopterin-dependent oxidoreductase [Vicinamibacterales bacterium]